MLPAAHQDHDPNKMAIVYYSLCGLKALGTSIDKYKSSIEWILRHYKSYSIEKDNKIIGGFMGSLTLDIKNVVTTSLVNTLFALLCLKMLDEKDFFEDCKKLEAIGELVKKCQNSNGSFVSALNMEGTGACPTDDTDLRYTYMAVSILTLIGCKTTSDFSRYINFEKTVEYIMQYQTIEGAFGEYEEAHVGYTSCALSSLALLNSLDRLSESYVDKTIDWLVHRQISTEGVMKLQEKTNRWFDEFDNGGFQGRPNKFADTCYAFWDLNSLKILTNQWQSFIDIDKIRNYLLEKTQNSIIGGFGKNDDDNPDLYHTCLGIAALKLINGTFDGVLCIPN